MNVTRLAVLGFAILAGIAAFFLMMGDDGEAPVEIIRKVEEKTIRVLVADQDFQRGDRLTAGAVKWVAWPEKALSERYLTESAVDAADMEGAVARTLIVAGEPIVEAKIVKSGGRGMMSAVLAPGMRAITTRVTPETASGGFVLPGDRVDIYYTEPDKETNETVFTLLLENVRVLAIDAIYSDTPETPHIAGATATLELSPDDSEYFTTARNSRGQISLALRSVFEPDTPVEKKRRFDVEVIRYGRS